MGHDHVAENNIRIACHDLTQAFDAAGHAGHLERMRPQILLEHSGQRGIILEHEHALALRRQGSLGEIVNPLFVGHGMIIIHKVHHMRRCVTQPHFKLPDGKLTKCLIKATSIPALREFCRISLFSETGEAFRHRLALYSGREYLFRSSRSAWSFSGASGSNGSQRTPQASLAAWQSACCQSDSATRGGWP